MFGMACVDVGDVHGMGCMRQGACMAGGHAWQGCVCGRGGMHGDMHGKVHAWWGGGMCAGETVTEVGGTHPTGMHSCSILYFNFTLY